MTFWTPASRSISSTAVAIRNSSSTTRTCAFARGSAGAVPADVIRTSPFEAEPADAWLPTHAMRFPSTNKLQFCLELDATFVIKKRHTEVGSVRVPAGVTGRGQNG